MIHPRSPLTRRALLAGTAVTALSSAGAAPVLATAACTPWPAWEAFKRNFLSDDGRIAEPATPRLQTVSEAQGYAMFFALVAGDREVFERLLRWTENNLAGGDLTARLPAWLWGRLDDGRWGVVDQNSAADADLWIAYALGEAGRLWKQRRYVALASLLAQRVLREETAWLPGLGRTLLPGRHGFTLSPTRWRLNPSYVPLPLMRWFAARSDHPAWAALARSSLRLLHGSAPKGLAPDWVPYEATGASSGHFDLVGAPLSDREGAYNAIRVYAWLGMTSPKDPARAALLRRYVPMADIVQRDGVPPERVDALTARVHGAGNAGFSAALLPFLAALPRPDLVQQQLARLQSEYIAANAYYAQALALFGRGYHHGRWRFAADGSLLPSWSTPCSSAMS